MGNEHALLCSAQLHMSLHAPRSFPPRARTHISANHLSVLACRDATSSEHPSSSLYSRFVFPVLDYRCQQEAAQPKAPPDWGIFSVHFIMPAGSHSFPQPNGIKMDLKFLAVSACIFLFEHMRAHYSHVSSHFRLCQSLRNTSAAWSSQQGIPVTGRTILNLLLSLCDFPISGSHLPFGARQSGIWEGKVLIWPKAQQCVGFDQWVSFGFWVQARPSTPTGSHSITASLLFSLYMSYLWRLFFFFAKCFLSGLLSLIIVSCLLIYECVFNLESQIGDGTPAE